MTRPYAVGDHLLFRRNLGYYLEKGTMIQIRAISESGYITARKVDTGKLCGIPKKYRGRHLKRAKPHDYHGDS